MPVAEFCETTRGVGVCLDTGNTFPVAEAPLDFVHRVAPHVRHRQLMLDLLSFAVERRPQLTADAVELVATLAAALQEQLAAQRQAGRVPKLAGGASHTMRMDFALLDSKLGVDQAVGQIEETQKLRAPTIDAAPEK